MSESNKQNVPWIVHSLTEPPYELHTHGLCKFGYPELTINAINPLFIGPCCDILNRLGIVVIEEELDPNGQTFTYGSRRVLCKAVRNGSMLVIEGINVPCSVCES